MREDRAKTKNSVLRKNDLNQDEDDRPYSYMERKGKEI